MTCVPTPSPHVTASAHLLVARLEQGLGVSGVRTHSPHVAASTHLLIGEVRAEHKNERFADSLTACSGIDSHADK